MPTTKFLISERDGVEFEYNSEYIPEALDILYESGQQDTVKDRISFPKKDIIPRVVNENLEINANEILLMHSPCFIGNLILTGDLVLI